MQSDIQKSYRDDTREPLCVTAPVTKADITIIPGKLSQILAENIAAADRIIDLVFKLHYEKDKTQNALGEQLFDELERIESDPQAPAAVKKAIQMRGVHEICRLVKRALQTSTDPEGMRNVFLRYANSKLTPPDGQPNIKKIIRDQVAREITAQFSDAEKSGRAPEGEQISQPRNQDEFAWLYDAAKEFGAAKLS